jgi:signal transduction histidine kinase
VAFYTAILALSAFVAAVCAGFTLAQSPRQRATQIAALLGTGASWWALCQVTWNLAPDETTALHWMRLSTPGWAFLGGMVPHLMACYLDLYPTADRAGRQRRLRRAAVLGYAAGAILLVLAWLGRSVHGELLRTPWGWTHGSGPALLVFIAVISLPIGLTVVAILRNLQSPLSVAPRSQRVIIRVGILTPIVLTPLTDVVLPALGVVFPRLGSISYALFGLVALGSAIRFGFSFFTPQQFSDEILDTLHEGVALVTPGGVVRRANRSFARLCGDDPDALMGVALERVLAWEPPPGLRAVEEQHADLLGPGGDRIAVSVSSLPLRDQRGNVLGSVVVVRDRREIEALWRRMLTQGRLAAVGELAAGLAHEINNPLAYVRANLALLERHWNALADPTALAPEERKSIGEESRELIAESIVGVDRTAEIVRGVRHFTHAGRPAHELADLNALLDDAIAMLRPRVHPPELSLELRAGAIPQVPCTPQELRQVFLNLLVNALDAVGRRGRVVVSTRSEGDAVVAEVADDGCGMDAETLERIFDPFFTTKSVGEGTGLGLGIAWHIVNSHGGRIEVESAPGAGAIFRVRLPAGGAAHAAE